MKTFNQNVLSWSIKGALLTLVSALSVPSLAYAAEETEALDTNKLEVIQVTARKRTENAQEIPVSVTALQGDKLNAYSSADMDIRFLNGRVPSLSVESSFGRTFPRFYMRGLGNSDFDLIAS